jgi:hypothetical protein
MEKLFLARRKKKLDHPGLYHGSTPSRDCTFNYYKHDINNCLKCFALAKTILKYHVWKDPVNMSWCLFSSAVGYIWVHISLYYELYLSYFLRSSKSIFNKILFTKCAQKIVLHFIFNQELPFKKRTHFYKFSEAPFIFRLIQKYEKRRILWNSAKVWKIWRNSYIIICF